MRRVLAAFVFLAGVVAPVLSQPVFRAGTELVRIDALVTDDGVPVEGLAASDFEVRDNRVVQTVAAIATIESVQLGVVLDASGSMTGGRMALARRATSDLLGQLTQADRFSVVAFGDQVGIVANRGTSVADAVAALESLQAGGGTALLDATFAGILAADGGDGPKLLLVLTDGGNNASWLQAGAVIDAARRHETVVYPVAVDPDRRWPGRVMVSAHQRQPRAPSGDRRSDWRPSGRRGLGPQSGRGVPDDPARVPAALHHQLHADRRRKRRWVARPRSAREAARRHGARPHALLGRTVN